MKTVTVMDKPVAVYSGLVGLKPEQSKERMHALRATKSKGVFEVVAPINFKRGEVFGYDGDLGKDGSLRDEKAEANLAKEADDKAAAKLEKRIRAEYDREYSARIEHIVETAKAEAVAGAEAALLAKGWKKPE